MLDDFFQLNAPSHKFSLGQFTSQLETSKHICNIIFEPNDLADMKISGTTFENVSFAKTNIQRVTFIDCKFEDCLFIGTKFLSVEFHGCSFINCNFHKTTISKVYGKPFQFRDAISNRNHANIAVHLYSQLRDNYRAESQRKFKNEAEYYFAHWERVNEWVQSTRKGTKWYKKALKFVGPFLHEYLLGFGYRLRYQVYTTISVIIIAVAVNYFNTYRFFDVPVEPSLIRTIYFTMTTMVTLGANGYHPNTETGYVFVIFNALAGVTILSATITALFKRVTV